MHKNNVAFALLYLLLDITWISIMSRIFYNDFIYNIQGKAITPKLLHAFLAYVVLLISMFYVCIPLSKYYKEVHPSLVFGLVGFCIYGVYNFKNGAIFEKYNNKMIVVDTIWGIVSFATMGYFYKQLFKNTTTKVNI